MSEGRGDPKAPMSSRAGISEQERLRTLAEYAIMDTEPDAALDEIVELAADICGVPVALVSLVDDSRQWFKAKIGLSATETSRDIAFCARAIASDDDIFTVEDARVDDRFKDNPLVRNDPNVVFYAGAPLIVEGGAKLGTLCVIDREPRELTESQRTALRKLARVVVSYLEKRKEAVLRAATDAFNRTLLASIGDAVVSSDAQARVTYMNGVAETLTGWPLADALGQPMATVFKIINQDTRATVVSPVERVLREGVVVGLANHTLLIRRDGSEVPIEDSAAPIRTDAGALVGVVLVLRDATHEREIQAERERLFQKARRAEARAQSERKRLFETFMQATVGVAVLEGPQHLFSFANGAYRTIVGGREVVGKPLFDALPELRDSGFDRLLDRVKETKQAVQLKETAVDLANGRFVFDFTYAPFFDEAGGVEAVIATVVDVTAQVESRTREATARALAEDTAARSRFLLAVATALGAGLERDALLKHVLDTIVPERADVATVWRADETKQIHREAHSPEEAALQLPAGGATPRKFPPGFPIQHVIETGELLRIDDLHAWLLENGFAEFATLVERIRLEHGLYAPIRRQNEVVGVLAVARHPGQKFSPADEELFTAVATQIGVTLENARLHAELGRLRDAAEAATLAKDDFLARVSHDLRNPIGAIVGWANLLKSGNPSAGQLARGMTVIERSAQAQMQLIEDLLDVSRIVEGKMLLAPKLEEVEAAIELALEPARLAAKNKGVHLEVQIAPDVGAMVVDPDRFRQVVWNLASNAVKFTPAGGSISVRADRNQSVFELVVRDSGKGIAASFLPRVFAAFEQAGEKGSARAAGLGLGLSIVHHIVELHGGTITAESEGEGKGATFTVCIPIRVAPWSADHAEAVRSGPQHGKLAAVRIVAIDDEDDAREVVAAILSAAGAKVWSASSADEGLALVAAHHPDIIVSDITMPEKDGLQFVRELRQLPEAAVSKTPAVALTAMARSRDRVEATSAGFNTHVPKPVEVEELVAVILGLLSR